MSRTAIRSLALLTVTTALAVTACSSDGGTGAQDQDANAPIELATPGVPQPCAGGAVPGVGAAPRARRAGATDAGPRRRRIVQPTGMPGLVSPLPPDTVLSPVTVTGQLSAS